MKAASRIFIGLFAFLALAAIFLALSESGLQAQTATSSPDQASPVFVASDPVTPLLSQPVRDMVAGSGEKTLYREINPLRNPHLFSPDLGIPGSNTTGLDALAANSVNNGRTPSPLFTFEGVPSLDSVTPPDTNGDVGPDHYVQMTNFHFAIYDKTGALLSGPTALSTLFTGTPNCAVNNGDPVVVYDELADRWLLSQFSINGSPQYMCIAISQTPDPTGAYYLYQFATPDFPDYPKFGVWPDAYYMTTNTGFPNAYYAYAFDRVSMLAGATATFQAFGGFPNFMMPADLDGDTPPPAGTPGYFYTYLDGEYPDHPVDDDLIRLYEFDVDWATPGNTTFTELADYLVTPFNYTVCGFFVQDCIPQPGTSQTLDSLSYWPMFRLAYRNLSNYEAMVGNFTVDLDGTDKAAIRWFELRRTGAGAWGLEQEGTYAPDGDHRWMGSIAMDGSGNIALGYSVSSNTTIPSIRYATRLRTDPLGTLQAEATMYAGTGVQTGIFRWGDYSAMSVDPVDDCTFWYTTEYHDVNDSGFGWNTRVGTFRLPECTGALFPDFYLSATPTEQSICTPSTAPYTITVGQVMGYTDPVTLSASGEPAGTTVGFSTNPVTPPGSSTMTIGNTGAAAAGSYDIEVMGVAPTSTHTTTVSLNVFTAVPGTVTLISPSDGDTNIDLSPTLIWGSATQGESYTVEVADDAGFTNIVYAATVDITSETLPIALSPLTTYYWRVTPDNSCGDGSASTVFSFTTADIPPILVVDDDNDNPDVLPYYTDALDALGAQYDVWDTGGTDNEPTAVDLAPYDAVIWFTGVSFGGSAGPGASGEAALGTWLDDGGCFFISAQDYYFDRGLTPFMDDYLGVSSATSDVGQTTVTGAGSVFSGLGPYSLSFPFTNWSDLVFPDGPPAELAFSGDVGDAAVDKDSGVYRTTFWGFPFEAIPTASDREQSMQTVLNWCGALGPTGVLEGTVTDADSSLGIEGATVTAVGPGTFSTQTDANGFYDITLPIGTYDVTASADNYVPETVTNIDIITDTTETQDFVLQGSALTYSPPEIEESMEIGDVVTNTVTVTNTGPLPIDWSANIGNYGGPAVIVRPHTQPISIPRYTGQVPQSNVPSTTARAPEVGTQVSTNVGEAMQLMLGAPAYGLDVFPGLNLVMIPDVDVPGTWNTVGSVTQFHPAGDFLNGDFSTLYALDYDTNQFVSIDTATAVRTVIGTSTGSGSWSGMTGATDGTLYALSTNCGSDSTLYEIDPSSGALTMIGNVGAGTCIIDIAINAAGEMYGVDIVSDSLYQIDPTTGVGTVVGSLGVDANFAQGMDFDELSGVLYWAAYTTAGEMRIIDTSTGASALVGSFPGGAEVDAFAIAAGGSSGSQWASAVPDSGTIPANSTATFDVVFDARSLYQVGDYTAELTFDGTFVNVVPTMPLTMHLSCPTCGFLAGDITDSLTGDPVDASIHVTSTNGFDATVNGSSYSLAVQPATYYLTVEANGYLGETATAVVTQGNTTTTDFELDPAVAFLDYSPSAIEEWMEIGDIVTNTVTVTNDGFVDLEFTVNIGGYGGPLLVQQVSPAYVPPTAANGTAHSLQQLATEKANNLLGTRAVASAPEMAVLLDQQPNGVNGLFSDSDCGLCGTGAQSIAENFSLASSETIGQIIFWTGYYPGDVPIDPDQITVIFHEDSGGFPGTAVSTESDVPYERIQTGVVLFGVHEWMHTLTLDTPVTLGPGNYWVEIFNATIGSSENFFWETGNIDTIGNGLVGSAWATSVPGSGWNYDGATELAVQLVTGSGGTQWASAVPDSGTVPPHSSSTFEVVFDARSLYQIGDYTAELSFDGNFVNDPPVMPLTMHLSCPSCGNLVGSVFDDATGDPLSADFHVTGPNGFDVSFSGETYAIGVQPGDYTFEVSADGYVSQTETVNASAGVTTTTDFSLRPDVPEISISPLSIEVDVATGSSATEILTIENSGAGASTFRVREGDSTPLVPGALFNQGSHSFDSTAVAVGPTSVRSAEGRTTLDALVTPEVWSDGTSLPSGDGVVRYAHAQCADDPDSFYVISGVNEALSVTDKVWRYDADTDSWTPLASFPVAQEGPSAACYEGYIYVVGGGGTTQFYIYDIAADSWMTGASLPRGVWGAAVGAWDGTLVMLGGAPDFSAGTASAEVNIYDIASDTWTGNGSSMLEATSTAGYAQAGEYVYVVGGWGTSSPGSNVTMTQRYDISSDAWESGPAFTLGSADFALAMSSQNLYAIGGDANGGGFFDASTAVDVLDHTAWPAGSWASLGDPLSSPRTANNGGFCTDDGSAKVWSVAGIDLSFIVSGAPNYRDAAEGCFSGAVDVPWLSEDPEMGSVAGDSSAEVNVTFTALPTLTVGSSYTATLIVTTQDPVNNRVEVQVQMNVVEVAYGVDVSSDMALSGAAGETVTYTLYVTNTGNVEDTFNLTLGSHNWTTTMSHSSVTLDAGEAAMVMVHVTIPADAAGGDSDTVTMTATSAADSSVSASTDMTTSVQMYTIFMPVIFKP